MNERLVANATRFPHETIDDETILFDADTGHVLLLAGFASTLWSHLVGGAVPSELVAAVAARFGAEAGVATRTFVDGLRNAEIIVTASEGAPVAPPPSDWPAEFAVPILERYDDLAKIMAMDPIHEVDVAAGWPRPAPDRKT